MALVDQATLKKKTAVSRSWILFDCKGQSTVLDVDKYVIMRRVQIHARDLRILDPMLSYPSTILGRDKVIVLNLEHIKAIITSEEVLVRDPMDNHVIPVVEQLQRRLAPDNLTSQGKGEEEEHPGVRNDYETGERNEFPFEFRALEVALEAICSFLDARTRELETDTYPALDELTSKVRDELEQLLDDDDDMADLYLSRKSAVASSPASDSGAPNWFPGSPTIGSKISRTSKTSAATTPEENDVEELEMLLEAYFMQIDGTLNKLSTLREYIDDTEDYINIQLDNHRNQLIQLELFLSSGTVCLTIYSLVAAIFGMNIPYTWKTEHGYVFKWVVIVTGIVCASLFSIIIFYARHKGLVES
ncbi:magnesium transporter MRS2-I-like isoform X2 [Mangifera indica]|uniref:magnesium transporter MRS2-I-like isoform X2 n=1 Tax=Mangifera indica TaxID=29780 RepID=UPI001CF9E5AC|nr:magnesium transporter MRS2-I-like isoform X2 [Mangifera indica]XP_044466358.1 magnesium transporter MRS2-I-like isoform X2 [Mangifera indica]